MKLSLIVPVYKDPTMVKRILNKLNDQTCKRFEVVLVVDTNIGNTLDVIDSFVPSYGKRIKVVFNSKRVGRTSALYGGFNAASGTYSMILDSSDKFNNKLVKNILDILKIKTADVIEFKTAFRSPIKFETNLRYSVKNKTVIEDDKRIISYASSFDFNKIYKTSLLKKVAIMPKLTVQNNSRFSAEIAYKTLLHAKTYQTENQTLVSSYSSLSPNYNPLKSIRQFNEIIQWSAVHGHNYETELRYAMFVQMSIFLFGFTGASKNKVLLKKLAALYEQQLNTNFFEFKNTNEYVLANNKETLVLRKKHTTSSLVKLYKELR